MRFLFIRLVILRLVRLGRAVCAGGVVLAIGVAAATAPASTASCGPANGRTLASSSQARVYEGRKGVVYGCAGTRQFRLGRRDVSGRPCLPCVGRVVVADRIAAYVFGYPGYDSNFCEVVVRRLSDGKRLATYNATRKGPFSSVPSLVARPDGHVAWIAVGGGIPEVHRDRTILDSGRKIQPHSLRLHGTLLTWKHGSKTRHARMR
jgi:hypothetical protein